MHLSTLQTKLKFFQYCKLCTRNAALYRPLQRQTSQQDLAHRLTAVADLWSKQSWRGWCALLLCPGKVPCQVDLPGKKFRKRTAAAISSQKAEGSGRPAVRRRPSSKHPGPPVPKKGRFAARLLRSTFQTASAALAKRRGQAQTWRSRRLRCVFANLVCSHASCPDSSSTCKS